MSKPMMIEDIIEELRDGQMTMIGSNPQSVLELTESALVVRHSFMGRRFDNEDIKIITNSIRKKGVEIFSLTLKLGSDKNVDMGFGFTIFFNVLESEYDSLIKNLLNQKNINIAIADSSTYKIDAVNIENTTKDFAKDYLAFETDSPWSGKEFNKVCKDFADELSAINISK